MITHNCEYRWIGSFQAVSYYPSAHEPIEVVKGTQFHTSNRLLAACWIWNSEIKLILLESNCQLLGFSAFDIEYISKTKKL